MLDKRQCSQVIGGAVMGAVGTLSEMADMQTVDEALVWLRDNIAAITDVARALNKGTR